MEELGSILREARERRGMSIDDVANGTRINEKFLKALEASEFGVLPTPVHVRGYLRNYARFLQIDPDPLIDKYNQFEANYNGQGFGRNQEISAETPLPPRQDNPFFNPVNMQLNPYKESGGGADNILRIIIILALIASILLIGSRFFSGISEEGFSNPIEAVGNMYDTVFNEEEPSVDDINVEEIVEDSQAELQNPLFDTSRNAVESSEPTAVPTIPTLTNLEIIDMRIEVTTRTWMQITVDGSLEFEGQKLAGDVLEFTAVDDLKLLTGNANGLFVTINDTQLGRLGAQGEPFEFTWMTGEQ